MAEAPDPAEWEAQVEEVQALEAIFGEDFAVTSAFGTAAAPPEGRWDAAALAAAAAPAGPWTLSFQLAVHVEPPESGIWEVALKRRSAADAAPDAAAPPPGHPLRHLPPVMLSVGMSPGYPASSPPECHVGAMWLSPAQAAELEAELAAIWEAQGPGLPVCWSWADWIQCSAAAHLTGGACGRFELEADAGAAPDADEGDGVENGGAGAEDRLVVLLRYSAAREAQLFRAGTHVCGVCFEEKRGDRFVRLDCRHAFCADCVGAQARVHVGDGTLEALRCPEPGCGEALGAHVLRRLLDPPAYERWEALTLQRALDSMPDAAYCPRCNTLSLEDLEENTADCPRCFFVFCTLCTEGRHPGQTCVSAETRLEMLRRKAAGGGDAAVAELRRKELELSSLTLIEKTAKGCPSCGMAIQRSEGCNKMVCGNCGAFFCYKCGRQITDPHPYDHFKAGGTCVLFDEEEILRWERRFEDQAAREAAAFRNDYLLEFGGRGGYWQHLEDAMVVVDLGGGGPRARRGGDGGGRGGALPPVANCPCCGQPNYRLARNNHMQCWSCTRHFCANCRMVLQRRGGGAHFGPSGCPQHS